MIGYYRNDKYYSLEDSALIQCACWYGVGVTMAKKGEISKMILKWHMNYNMVKIQSNVDNTCNTIWTDYPYYNDDYYRSINTIINVRASTFTLSNLLGSNENYDFLSVKWQISFSQLMFEVLHFSTMHLNLTSLFMSIPFNQERFLNPLIQIIDPTYVQTIVRINLHRITYKPNLIFSEPNKIWCETLRMKLHTVDERRW